jgi:riboflavin biosynthesis pyrimidine reductase
VVLGEREVPAARILDFLAVRGKKNVLLEGGGEILWTFIQAGMVDALQVTLIPSLAGGASASTLLDGAGFPSGMLLALRLEEVRQMGEELFLRYSVRKE